MRLADHHRRPLEPPEIRVGSNYRSLDGKVNFQATLEPVPDREMVTTLRERRSIGFLFVKRKPFDVLDEGLVSKKVGAARRLLNFLLPGAELGRSLAALSRGLGPRRHCAGFFVLFTASWSSFSKAVSIAFSPGPPTHL
jgi:hypothetical protein